ncbi:hypothetical protein BGX38DRAFT_1260863 [Terfezia claveryi]|nr:hypothetical protein BGX38DRAFT_1260863 [Terfezia claveryi]
MDLIVNKPSRVGPQSRSFFAIPNEYKELTSRAAKHVRFYTLFGNPMLNAEEIQQLLSVAWLKAQEETREKLKRMKTANAYLHSIYLRTRAQLIYECTHSIVKLFALNYLPQHEIAERVKNLLFQDRFICREDGREAHQRHFHANEITEIIFRKYFSNMKMRGNSDDTFFDSINEVFICLVTSAMRHCLKAWTTGVYVEPPSTANFRYDTTITTWNAHPRKLSLFKNLPSLQNQNTSADNGFPMYFSTKIMWLKIKLPPLTKLTILNREAQECDDDYEPDDEDR